MASGPSKRVKYHIAPPARLREGGADFAAEPSARCRLGQAPSFDQSHDSIPKAPSVVIDRRLLGEIGHHDQHVFGDGLIAVAQVQQWEMAVIGAILPSEEKVGSARGLSGIGASNTDQAGDSLTGFVKADGTNSWTALGWVHDANPARNLFSNQAQFQPRSRDCFSR